MTGLNLRSMSVVLLAAAAGLSACKAKSTYVHVQILPGPQGEPTSVTQIELDLNLGGKTSTLTLGNAAAPITLPTDVTLEVKSGSGQLAITAIARNAAGAEVDRGATTAQVSTGAIAEATVQLPGGKPDVKTTEGTGAHDFGAVPEGTSSASVNVSFINNGFRPSGPLSIALGGVGASAFALGANNCAGTALAPGAICSVAVQFQPTTLGALAATLTATGTPGGSTVVTLTGTGSNNPLTLTVTLAGTGNGAVVASPSGLSCATASCSGSFEWGTSVTLTATPATGSTFTGWAGCDSVAGNDCTVAMTSARTATATFTPFTVSVIGGGNGSGTIVSDVGGIACTITGGVSSGTCSTSVSYGSNITLTQTAATNSTFGTWSGGGCSGSGATCTISNIISSPQNVTTPFTLKTFAVTVTTSGTGTVTSPDTSLSCNATTCTATVNYGSTATLNGTAASGFIFVGWSAGSCTGTGSCVLSSITSDQSVTANFPASFCASSVTVGQAFGTQVQGCPGAVSYANRATLCGAGAHACNANEWVQGHGATAPTHHYWTDDSLNWSSGSGSCGAGGCTSGSCFASTGTLYTSACTGNPMRVCAGTGASGVTDPEGNSCNWTGCGFNSISPKQFFGGCASNTTAGTLCCSNAQHQYFVSTSGSDANPGTSAAPFKTITHALASAAAKDTVFAKTGVYDATNGETFPMNVPANVNLIGDETSRGASPLTKISGTVVPGAGATVAGFTITASGNGISASSAGATIRNNTLTGNTSFPLYITSPNQTILLNAIVNNSSQMLYTTGSSASGKFENNTVTGNSGGGVEYDAPGADMGGGAGGSIGNNILSCNARFDVWAGSAAITASSNKWDHAPPSSSNSSFGGGLDLYYGSFTSSQTSANTGATVTASPCNICSSAAVSTQTFDLSMNGCVASGTPAAIAFGTRASICGSQVGCHACTAAEWNSHRGAIAPGVNYWTADTLLWNGSGTGLGCQVSATNATFTNPCGGGAMLVCPDSGSLCQSGALQCGLDTTVNQHFGGCSNSTAGNFGSASGTLCCCQ